MDEDVAELSVSEARSKFSDAVNRAAYGGEITFITRGRSHKRAAAIVPADLVEQYEQLLDLGDGRVAAKRLADIRAGRTAAFPTDDVAAALGL